MNAFYPEDELMAEGGGTQTITGKQWKCSDVLLLSPSVDCSVTGTVLTPSVCTALAFEFELW
jgi:hypothetical protein